MAEDKNIKVTKTIGPSKHNANVLEENLCTKTVKKQHICSDCNKTFAYKQSLTQHMRTHSGEKPFKCEICKKSFSFKKNLNVHVATHSNKKCFKCEVCEKGFKQRYYFNYHMRTHTGEKFLKCGICERRFSKKSILNNHMVTHSGEKPFRCGTCKKSFSGMYYLIVHMRIHSDEKPFQCDSCNKGFASKRILTQHIRTHWSEKPYKCDICGKSFAQKGTLNVHMISHSGAKPFKCEACNKSFVQKGGLKYHMATHSNENRFKCEVCEMNFTQKAALYVHMKTHSVEKCFRCKACRESFADRYSLNQHMTTYSVEESFKCFKSQLNQRLKEQFKKKNVSNIFEKCHLCNNQFISKSRLDDHMKMHTTLDCPHCCRSTRECVCSKNFTDDKAMSLAKDKFLIECQTCLEKIPCKSQLKLHLKVHSGHYQCTVCNNDYINCNCPDDDCTDIIGKLTDPVVKVKEEETFTPISELYVKKEMKSVELSETVVSKCDVCMPYSGNNDKGCCWSDNYIEVTKSIDTYQEACYCGKPLGEKASESVVKIKEEIFAPLNELEL